MNTTFTEWFEISIEQLPDNEIHFFYPDMDVDGLSIDIMLAAMEYLRLIGAQ